MPYCLKELAFPLLTSVEVTRLGSTIMTWMTSFDQVQWNIITVYCRYGYVLLHEFLHTCMCWFVWKFVSCKHAYGRIRSYWYSETINQWSVFNYLSLVQFTNVFRYIIQLSIWLYCNYYTLYKKTYAMIYDRQCKISRLNNGE